MSFEIRSLLMVVLMTTACSGHGCTRSSPTEPTPPTGTSAQRTLTLEQFEERVYGPGPKATFAETTASEHTAVAALIPKLLDGARADAPPDPLTWQREANAGGFHIEIWRVGGETYWALVEPPGKSRGAGAYVFRVGGPRETGPTILLEAPHNFYDMGTGRLAAELFFAKREPRAGRARPRALFTNTIHRYQLAPGDKRKRRNNPADVAHQPDHAFTVATVAFARTAGTVRVIQLHGFGSRDEDGDDGDAGSMAMVVSAGDPASSSPISAAIADALVRGFGSDVKRFPEEAKVLGATTNAQGKLLRAQPNAAFIHVEMSAAMRKRLAAEPAARAQLASALFDTSDPP
jgi:hypothetical protein